MRNPNKRFKTIAAVLILLTRKNTNGDTEYLLQKRRNTGFADGMWDFSASGHVEKDEPMTKTVCREANEEIGIHVEPENIEFMGLFHSVRTDNEPMLLACFIVTEYSGKIKINEPDKISELKWFKESDLPDNIIGTRKTALTRFKNEGIFYQEFGW